MHRDAPPSSYCLLTLKFVELSYGKAVFWYYSDIVRKKKGSSRRFVQDIYYHGVAMNLSDYNYFWGGLTEVFCSSFCC